MARRSYPRPRSGAAAERSNLTSKEQWVCGRRRAERSYSMFKVRRVSSEEIPLVQGKEQRLRVAGAAMKRYPTPEARGGGREDQPHIQGSTAARAQEGLEELSHIESQEGQW